MPKATKPKYYAVRVGKGGPQIYTAWNEVSDQAFNVGIPMVLTASDISAAPT